MAVQKSKVTRSKRGMRRAHDKVAFPSLRMSKNENRDGVLEVSVNHHLHLESGYYRGRQVVQVKQAKDQEDQD